MLIKRLAFLTILVTYLLIVYGGYVSSSQSGMGCGPEWPLCHGEIIPKLQGETLVEFTHRVIGAIVVFLTVTLCYATYRRKGRTQARFVVGCMIGLLAVQVIFGAVIVIYDLPVAIVSSHMLLALLFLSYLIWLWRIDSDPAYPPQYAFLPKRAYRKLSVHLNLLIVLLFLTFGVGAYVKHQALGLACDWWGCRDTWLPATSEQVYQTLHRVLAVISSVYVLFLAFVAVYQSWDAGMKNRLMLAAAVVLVQIAAGIMTIVSHIELTWAIVHLAIGTALFAIVVEARIMLGLKVRL